MRNHVMQIIVVCGMFLILMVLAAPSAFAQDPGPKVISPGSVAYGRTYSEWSAAWNQWADSIPVAEHPLFDNGDCSVGQSGPVWFLGGKFCAIGTTCTYTAVRNCSVPAGKALFFPVVDFEDSALEESVNVHPGDPTYQQIAKLRSVTSSVEGATDIYLEIDNAGIPNLSQKFAVQSVAFGFTLPADNLFKAVYAPPNNFEAGEYFPAVDDGYYVMLSPLPPGNHVIHFGASWLNITYYITVAK